MDPVSLIGLLGALCNLIEASNQLLQVAKALKEGDKDLHELLNDVSYLAEALKGFDRVLRSSQTDHNISRTVINKAIEESSTTIQELERRISQIAKFDTSAVRRVRWLQNKSIMKKLHERVKTHNSMLQSFLALAHTETFLNACDHYPQLLQVSSLTEVQSQSQVTQVESNPSELTPVTSGELPEPLSCVSVRNTSFWNRRSSTPLQEITSNMSESSSNQEGNGYSLVKRVVRTACRFDCYCSCHLKSETGTSEFSLGRAVLQSRLSGLPCDSTSCQSRRDLDEVSGSMSRLFHMALSQIMIAHKVKVRYHISKFHMVSENSDVMRYIRQGDLDSLRTAIQADKATLFDTTPDGWSVLHTATYNRQLPTVKYLLELGCDTEVTDIGARKPIDLALLKWLVNGGGGIEHEITTAFGSKTDRLSEFEFTPIHIAVLGLYDMNDLERPSLEQLLELVDECNNAPVRTNWVKWKSQYKRGSPLFGNIIEYFRASAYEQPKNLKIIHNLVDQKNKGICWTPLHWACSIGKRDTIRTLMYHGADPSIVSTVGSSILHAAAESQMLGGLDDALNICRLYPEKLNINQRNRWGETPLHIAAFDSVRNVRSLLEAGADRNCRQEDGQVPLHYTGMTARGETRLQLINLLCKGDGHHINSQDTSGRPPLFDFLDDVRCVEVLVQHGANLYLKDAVGKSVFHHACIGDNEEALEALIRLSSPESMLITIKDHNGNTPLLIALNYGNRCCALKLLESDNVGDMMGQDGWSAIHHAARLGDCKILEAVLERQGHMKDMKTVDGKTAEMVAMEAGTWSGGLKDLLRRRNSIV